MTLIILLAGPLAPGLAGADPSPSSGGEQGKREEVKKQRTKVVSQIDLLRSSDVDLQVEVNRLGSLVKTAEGQVNLARAGLAEVESKLGGLTDEVEQGKRDAEIARHRAAERAVDAYMHPGVETLGAVLEARDYDQAHRRRTIIGEVGRHDQEILQGHLDAQKALAARQGRLSEAQHKADELRQDAEDSLGDLRAAQAKQVETKQALEARIRDFQSEANELAAQDANLTAIINQRTAENRAKAADSNELAAPPTGPASTSGPAPTTAAPPSAPAATAAATKASSGANAPATAAPASAAPATTAKAAAPPTTARPAPSGSRLAWPLSGPLTSPFGMRWGALHAGIDIGVPIGTPIHAAAAGTVIFCGQMGGYGNVVLVDHGNGLVSLYGHQDRLACSDGQRVGAGQVIGYSGNTGHSTGPHLHFEVRRNGTPVDPMQYLA